MSKTTEKGSHPPLEKNSNGADKKEQKRILYNLFNKVKCVYDATVWYAFDAI